MPNAATYAKMHRNFLEKNHPEAFQELKASGKLTSHVAQAGRRAMEMYDHLESEMRNRILREEPDYQKRLSEMKHIPLTVEEILLHEAVYAL